MIALVNLLMYKQYRGHKTKSNTAKLNGTHAILGMDMAAFSTLSDEDQMIAIQKLYVWTRQALRGEGISQSNYRWSPAGDGGYLTFISHKACELAIDVAFAILKKSENSSWMPTDRKEGMRLRFGLNLGMIEEGEELGGHKNVWGLGINRTARIVAIAAPSQILVSRAYFDEYIAPKHKNKKKFDFREPYSRTVKHGDQVEVINITYKGMGLDNQEATANRWYIVGHLWKKTIEDYKMLIEDAMRSGSPLAALAASKFLINLGEQKPVRQLCKRISQFSTDEPDVDYPKRYHKFFSSIPNDLLYQIVEEAEPYHYEKGDLICSRGDESKSTFFLVSGIIKVEGLPGGKILVKNPEDEIFGEFGLWINNIKRTATLRADDSCLLLSISNIKFQNKLDDCPTLKELTQAIIKSRIIENLRRSSILFPEETLAADKDNFKSSREGENVDKEIQGIFTSAECKKYQQNETLYLTSNVYILFNGEVKIYPSEEEFLITADGTITPNQVIGIVSDNGNIDGYEAKVMKESVLISFSTENLKNLQKKHTCIAEHWDSLYGRRCGEIARYKAKRQSDRGEKNEGVGEENP